VADKTLFFALWPSDRQRDLLRDTINPALTSVEGSIIDRRNWHVTLVYVGTFPEESIPGLRAAVDIVGPINIRLRFDRLTFWQRPRVACLDVLTIPPELEQLVKSIEQALVPFAYTPQERTYRPHITAARKVRAFPEVRLSRAVELQWSGFELVESISIRGDIQYRVLKQ